MVCKKIIIICGPTAAQKTSIAIELAGKFNGEIVGADSGQVWRGFDIGTAKTDVVSSQGPGSAALAYHLIDVVGPEDRFDAAQYVKLADRAISGIIKTKALPFVVGGTGMYLRMLVHGYCAAPPRDEAFRKKMEAQIKDSGIETLHSRLKEIDSVSASHIHEKDKTRIVRALEIFEQTGITAGEFYRKHKFAGLRYNALKIGLHCPRQELYRKIDERVDKMIAAGWVKETEGLLKLYGENHQAFNAIGYKELAAVLAGRLTLDDAITLIKRNSRRFAKRQITWFRADHEIKWFNPSQMSVIREEISNFISKN